MKKVLSLVLAFAMILGSFGFVFASDFPDVPDTEYYSEPVNVLSGLGVIGGFPDGTFGPEKEVTRAQMATMIINALGMTVTGQADTKFSDVPASHWASGFINYAASVGFIAGYPDGTFKPDTQVTYDQALTMIVAALGYKADALTGSWPGSFVNQARGLGILDICKATGTANAPRQDIACYLYKALTSPIGITNKDGEFVKTITGKDALGNEVFDTMIARLGAVPYKNGEAFVVTGEEDADINLKNYLGAYITAYASKDDDTNIVAVKEVLSVFIEGDADDLKDDYKAYDSATKTKYVSFKNGEAKDPGDDYVPMSGDLKLAVKLSGKTIKEVYSVQVWEAAKTFMAKADIQDEINEDQTLDEGLFEFALDEDDEIDTKAFAMVGKDSLADLKKDDVITVYVNDDNEVVKLEVSDKTIEGEITKKTTGTPTKYTIAGTAYGVNKDNSKTYAIGDEGTFFLDYAGKIFKFEAADDSSSNYAIVLQFGEETGRYDGPVIYAKMFLADGSVKEFEVKEDATKARDADDKPTGAAWAVVNKADQGILVKYTVNAKDQISKFEPADPYVGAGEFSAKGIFDDGTEKWMLASDAVIFAYSGTSGDPDDTKDSSKYSVMTGKELFGSDFDDLAPFVDDHDYLAAVVNGIKGGDEAYAFFFKHVADEDGAELWTALYDGKYVEELEVEDSTAVTTTGAAAYYAVKVGEDGVVNTITGPKTAGMEPASLTGTETTVENGIFKDAAGNPFELNDDVVVYVKSGDKWSGKGASAMAGRVSKFDSITLIDTDGKDGYDIVIVIMAD